MNENTTIEKMRRMRMNTMADLYHASLTENLYREMHLEHSPPKDSPYINQFVKKIN